ncbi:MAG: MmgE/PrpD family protein [Rhodospirillales bacterium]|nr:MmgE/PrpD family protein [Rhodospirillales bacterium]HJO97086.1 MmgE/PrpD family protein [Rhodospirillales bacterium]
MGDRTISDAYAEWIASLEFESIPQSVVIDVRHRVLDNLGIQIAALSLPSTQAVIEAIGAWGGTPESSVPGLDVMVPAPSAALAAGLMGHSFDYDDTHFPTMMHTHAVIISAALAAGQAESRPGRDLVVAIVAGIETALRVALADPVGFQVSGLQPSSFVGIFGAAAAASRAKGLNAQRTRNALGIAGNQASGLLQSVVDGSDGKLFNCGWAAHGGVVAADLAARGLTAPAEIFEGQFGVYPVHLNPGQWETQDAIHDLGQVWHTPDVAFKLHSGCQHTHSFIDAIFELKQTNALEADIIHAIDCQVINEQVPVICEPMATKLEPETPYAARFSLPYIVAAALVLDDMGPHAYSEERLSDARIRGLARRVRYTSHADPGFPGRLPAYLTITLNDGRKLTASRENCRGAADDPIQDKDIEAKFRGNCKGILEDKQISALIETCSRLEDLSKAEVLLSLADLNTHTGS